MSVLQDLPHMPSAAEIVETIEGIISRFNVLQDRLVSTITPAEATYESVLDPLVQLQDSTQEQVGVIHMLQYAAPEKDTQTVVTQAISRWARAEAAWTAREDVFRLLQGVQQNLSHYKLDQESSLLLTEKLLDFGERGIGILDSDQSAEYTRRSLEIDNLCKAFQQNLANENGGLWFSHQELDGIPSESVAARRQEGGKVFVPFSNGGTIAVLQYAHHPNTRERMYLADSKKVSANAPIFKEIMEKRCAQAVLLGHANHASFRIQRRLAKSIEWVDDFLDRVKRGLLPLAQRELDAMQRRRHQDIADKTEGQDPGDVEEFPAWDKAYYTHLMKKELDLDQLKISEYFPLESTINNMLDVFSSFLNIRFDAISDAALGDHTLWHDTVRVYSVWEKNGEFTGYLYCDLLWRKNKYRGNQNVTHGCGYQNPDGSRHNPSTILMCSFPTTTTSKCVLLKHHQVVTLFHELGHAIHNLVSRTKYTRFHGTNLPPDFGEMPSFMLENWCWMNDPLKRLSCHYTTLDSESFKEWQIKNPGVAAPSASITDDLVDGLIKSRFFNQALYYSHQLAVSMFDLSIHRVGTMEEAADLNVQQLWYGLRKDLEGINFGVDGESCHGYATFTHLTAGYDVGYYSYLMCSAYAYDLFDTKFAHDPGNAETWAAYRRKVLQYGGSHPDMMQMLEDFLGHPPNPDALVETLQAALED